jgi:Holliday junction resolvase RusA-like endonuclease
MTGYFIKIKPLSVNDAWKGRRMKTDNYKRYERDLALLLPRNLKIPDGDLSIYLEWGFSSAASDWDNPIKPFQDILQKKYGFNDNRIFNATVKKIKVPKGSEYVIFDIKKAVKD